MCRSERHAGMPRHIALFRCVAIFSLLLSRINDYFTIFTQLLIGQHKVADASGPAIPVLAPELFEMVSQFVDLHKTLDAFRNLTQVEYEKRSVFCTKDGVPVTQLGGIISRLGSRVRTFTVYEIFFHYILME